MHFIASLKVTRRQNDDVEGCWETNTTKNYIKLPLKKNFFFMNNWHFCDDYTVTAASQEPCSRLLTTPSFTPVLAFFWPEEFKPVWKISTGFKKFKPKKNVNHNIIILYLCQGILNSVKAGFFSPMSTTEFFIYAFLMSFSPFMKVTENLVKE